MIYEKLMQIESALEDAEDRCEGLDSIGKWEATTIKKLQEALRELHGLYHDSWRNQEKEAGFFIAAICEITRKLESVQLGPKWLRIL